MARGAAKQRQVRKPAAPPPKRAPRRTSSSSLEQSMFFPRMRRQAKWAFAFMVLVFALSFVFLGVGSGSSGIGDLLQGHIGDIFGGGGSSTSISKLQEKVRKNPQDAHSWRLLGNQLNSKHRTAEAIAAYGRYVALRKHPDGGVLTTLATLQLQRASEFQTLINDAQSETATGNPFAPDSSSKLGQGIGADPIANAVSTSTQSTLQRAYAGLTDNLNGAVATYQKLAAQQPSDSTVQEQLGYTAWVAGKTKVAIVAYTKFLKLDPSSTDAPAVRQRLKALKAQLKAQPKVKAGK